MEDYQSTIFYHSDSLPTVLAFLFPKTYLKGCAVSTVLGLSYSSKACYYSPVNMASVYGQYSSFSLAEQNCYGTRQSGALTCSAFAGIY